MVTNSPLYSRRQSGGQFAIVDRGVFPGNVWFVDSGHSSASDSAGYGQSPDSPCATIDYAIGLCTANNGDVIFVAPGHTETISAAGGITMDVAGVTIIGQGVANNKPLITLGTATTATFLVSAANCRIENLNFTSAIDSLAIMVDINAGGFSCVDCKFTCAATYECLCFFDIATTFDDFFFEGIEVFQAADPGGTDAAASTGVFYFVDTENLVVKDSRFVGYFETAIFHNKTTAAKRVTIVNCELTNHLVQPFELVATAQGVCHNCYGATLVATDATEAEVYGTIGTAFWISNGTSLGNDSGGGGQGGITGTVAS